MLYRVYILLYPQLGGLGWLKVAEYVTKAQAKAKVAELLANGHERYRVGINV